MSAVALAEAQAEVRRAYLGGSVGQVYAGGVWLSSAAAWSLVAPTPGIVVLLLAGALVYPVTSGVSRLLGGAGRIPDTNPLRPVGLTVPIVGALGLPAALGATLYREDWFFPAMMIVMGAHYLPFWPLYGRWGFVALGLGMWGSGLVVALWLPGLAAAAGALTGLALLAYGALLGWQHSRTTHTHHTNRMTGAE